ncbi:tyrosine-type recombinase/integrase, partial [Chloroflexota bacterium]
MTLQIEPSSPEPKTKLVNQNGSSSGFFRLASQFLANTTANMTRDTYGTELVLFVRWFGGDGNVSAIKLEDLLNYKVLLEKQYSPATVAKKIAALKSFFGFAKRIGAIPSNPAEELRVAGATKDRIPSHLTVEEVRRLIKMPDRRTLLGKRDTAIIALLANSGMRRSEIMNLKISSFIYNREKHKQKERVYVKILGKGNKERMIMVQENIVSLLGDWVS